MKRDPLISGQRKSPWVFFALVFILSAPIWWIGPLVERLLPGAKPINVPASSLMIVCPAIAALILVRKETGWEGVKKLLQRSFDLRRIKSKLWYVPILLLMPTIMVLQHGLASPGRAPAAGPRPVVWVALVLSLVFFIAALGEELGWHGYVADLLLDRWNALIASVVLGTGWAIWHIVPLIQLGASPTRIVGQCIDMVVTRILIVWLYSNTGKSVFAAALYHTMYNVSTLLMPNYGLHYDPVVVCIFIAGAAALVTFLWGLETLARYRYARADKQSQLIAEEIE